MSFQNWEVNENERNIRNGVRRDENQESSQWKEQGRLLARKAWGLREYGILKGLCKVQEERHGKQDEDE